MVLVTAVGRPNFAVSSLMIPSVFEKFSYGIAVVILVAQKRMQSSDLLFGGIDLLLGVFFVIAYLRTPGRLI